MNDVLDRNLISASICCPCCNRVYSVTNGTARYCPHCNDSLARLNDGVIEVRPVNTRLELVPKRARRNPFTRDELILCTWIARYGRERVSESTICRLKNRPLNSVKMKVCAIAAMLRDNGYPYSENVTPLPAKGRPSFSHWDDIVAPLISLPRSEFRYLCSGIVDNIPE